jgi:[acyl-carrier-protein] S-malonyltransferase
MIHGTAEAPNIVDEAEQATRARRAERAARHRLSAMRRAYAAPPGVSALRNVPRATGRRGKGRLTPPRIICLFPGQGAQRVGMGRELAQEFACARHVFEEVDDALGFALSRLCFEGPAETLALTMHAQPALLACSVAAYRVARERVPFEVAAMAGHSLGEWSALVAADALALRDAAAGVRLRGRLMQEAVPVGVGAMAAIMGLDAATVGELCERSAAGEIAAPANLNGAGQVVVAGHRGAVERVVEHARARGAKVQLLPVSAPFHCALMAPAAEGVGRFLDGLAIAPPTAPVYSSVEARRVFDADDIRTLLRAQVTAPVRWEDTMRAIGAQPARVAVEFGAGRTLAALWKRAVAAPAALPVGDCTAVRALGEAVA